MKKTNLKEKLQNWKLGNYFRELSIVTAGVFITLAGTDFINSASQEKQINKSMQMIKMELEENLKSINQAEAAYEGGNLAASKIRNLECPSYEICLIDYGCGKFNRKIHIMEQYP